jgi:uncharacterized protein
MILNRHLHQEIVVNLSKFTWVDQIILFGSRSRGDAEERSDIDLTIAAPSATAAQWQELTDAVEELGTLLHIDLIRYEEAPPELLSNIRKEGTVLYERSKDSTESA